MQLSKLIKELDDPQVTKAYELSKDLHKDDKRVSGSPYIEHIEEMCLQLFKWEVPNNLITVALLHDLVRLEHTSYDEIKSQFGQDVADSVRTLDSITNFNYTSLGADLEPVRRLVMSLSKSGDTLLLRIADKLSNLGVLSHAPKRIAKALANETLDIYAPLAARFGLDGAKAELEEKSFAYLMPNEYKKVKDILKAYAKKDSLRLNNFKKSLFNKLSKHDIRVLASDMRVKAPYSLYRKLSRPSINMDPSKVTDILALRLIFEDTSTCYDALGIINDNWQVVDGSERDYIARPKPNGYQSIHRAVYTGDGRIIEIQLRTQEMHDQSTKGKASHTLYDSVGKAGKASAKKVKVPKWLSDTNSYSSKMTPAEMADSLNFDFLKERIFAYTPMGDVIELPTGASVLDFAFAIHTELASHAIGASVDGKFGSLDTRLYGGEVVEIKSSKSSKPSHKWLEYVITPKAKQKIQSSLSKR